MNDTENIVAEQEVVLDNATDNAQVESDIDRMMQFATSTDEQIFQAAQEAQPEITDDNTSVELLTNAETPADTQNDTPSNPFVDLGFNSKEELLAELDTLRKAKPLVQDEVYVNEESKKVHQLIKEGKIKDVIEVYQKKELAEQFDTLSEEQKIKLLIKIENPLFGGDEDLINYHYNKNYVFNEDSFDGDEMELKMAKISAKQKAINAIKTAEETISKYKEIQLPDISVPTTITQNKDYEDYMASVAKANEFNETVIVPKTNSLKEEDLKMSIEVNDPKSQMQFRVSVTPTKEQLEDAKKGVLNLNDFLHEVAYDEDGNYNPARAAQVVLRYKNFDNYMKNVARQAVNAERLSVINSKKNNGEIKKDFVINDAMSDVDKMMAYRMS